MKSMTIWGAYMLILLWRFVLNMFHSLNVLLGQDNMVLQISKCYSSYTFHLISAKLYEELVTNDEYRVLLL